MQDAHESAVEAETAAKVAEARQKLATPTATTALKRRSAPKGGNKGGLVAPSRGWSNRGSKDGHLPGVNV